VLSVCRLSATGEARMDCRASRLLIRCARPHRIVTGGRETESKRYRRYLYLIEYHRP
jgi:hypothetical protein